MDQDRFYRGAEIRVVDLAIPNKAMTASAIRLLRRQEP
jgi:hypothetical protein